MFQTCLRRVWTEAHAADMLRCVENIYGRGKGALWSFPQAKQSSSSGFNWISRPFNWKKKKKLRCSFLSLVCTLVRILSSLLLLCPCSLLWLDYWLSWNSIQSSLPMLAPVPAPPLLQFGAPILLHQHYYYCSPEVITYFNPIFLLLPGLVVV